MDASSDKNEESIASGNAEPQRINNNNNNNNNNHDNLDNHNNNRIPPPPLMESERNDAVWRDSGNAIGDNDSTSTPPNAAWVLCMRCPIDKTGGSTIVKVQVYPAMTADLLGRCTFQAIASCSSAPSEAVVGLFGERDGIFHSFDHILSLPNPTMQIYGTTRSFRREVKKTPSRWFFSIGESIILLLAVLAAAAWGLGHDVVEYALMVQREARYLVFDLPFRELYRHGPYFLGWEGMELSEVCSRITYHGNRDFWSRNQEECEAIYAGKEEAFLRVTRPVAYAMVLLISFLAIRHLVSTYAESKRNRTDRVVLETYHAFQTLVRLANRQPSTAKRN